MHNRITPDTPVSGFSFSQATLFKPSYNFDINIRRFRLAAAVVLNEVLNQIMLCVRKQFEEIVKGAE